MRAPYHRTFWGCSVPGTGTEQPQNPSWDESAPDESGAEERDHTIDTVRDAVLGEHRVRRPSRTRELDGDERIAQEATQCGESFTDEPVARESQPEDRTPFARPPTHHDRIVG